MPALKENNEYAPPEANVSHKLDGTDYAIGGAQTGPADEYTTSVAYQVDAYLAHHEVDPAALYVFWAGANDIGHALHDPERPYPALATEAAAKRLVRQVSKVVAKGAKNVLIINLPNMGATPSAQDADNAQLLSALSTVFNLSLKLNLLKNKLEVSEFDDFSSQKAINVAVKDKGSYTYDDLKITNVTTPLCDSAFSCDKHMSPGNPAEPPYDLYADGVHPSDIGHRILAKQLYAFINSPNFKPASFTK